MNPPLVMLVAGEPSGDANAADLVQALSALLPGARFIGAGGPKMAAAGVNLTYNLMEDATIGPIDVLMKLGTIRRRQHALAELAIKMKPDLIVLVDFYAFNHPWIRRLRKKLKTGAGRNSGWAPKIAQYTSPQVWASRPGRAERMAEDIDLLICFFPFEKEWYAKRGVPLRVEFAGHPMFDRHSPGRDRKSRPDPATPVIALLPGSRTGELQRHLPVMGEAAKEISAHRSVRFNLVAADPRLADYIRTFEIGSMPNVEIHTGEVTSALSSATLAITKTGTITLECAYFGVPAVALYKTSPLFYPVARRLITVQHLAMPNILAGETIYPEFIQSEATGGNIAAAAMKLLDDPARRQTVREKLQQVIDSLGGPGCAARGARLLADLIRGS